MNFTVKKESSSCGCGDTIEAVSKCPNCNSKGTIVSAVTIKAQLKKEKFENLTTSKDDFNFCNTPKCDTVYYSNDESEYYNQADIKSKITIKNDNPKTPLCYCKKLLKENVIEMIENNESDIPKKIKAIISEGKSFCEKSNPKGICCTEDIISFLKEYGIDFNEKKNTTFSLSPNPSSSCCSSSSSSSCC